MKFSWKQAVGAAAAGVLALAGCTDPGDARATRSSGSLALSTDDAFLYAADTDNGIVAVIDTKTNAKVADISLGKTAAPMRVVVGADDTIYVANRGDNSVSVIHRGDWSEAARLPVGIEPTGLALTPDGRQLLVTSSASKASPDFGTLTSFDTKTLQPRFEVPVGAEPRAVAAVSGNRAVVSLFKAGELVEVDLDQGVLKAGTGANGIYDKANASRTTAAGSFSTFHPRAMADLVVTPDGNRLFAPVVWAREDAIGRKPSAGGGYYSAGGPCNVGAVATAGVVAVDTRSTLTPQVDDLTACFSSGSNSQANADYPTSALAPSSPTTANAIQGPTVGVVDPTGSWLFLVNRETSNVAVMPAFRRTGDDTQFSTTGTSVRSVVGVGAGADGIALTRDGTKAYVYSQFDHRVEMLSATGHGSSATIVNQGVTTKVANDVLTPELAQGRRLFYDALDTRMSSSTTNVACATCHLEGREDGHVWEFPDGPRQTPALAGRHLLSTAPYHWSGEFQNLTLFNTHTITERMGGSGLTGEAADKLDRWIDQLPVASAMRGDAAQISRGKTVFETKAQCATCHTGELLTNNDFADVGTLHLQGTNADKGAVMSKGFNVPSLLGLSRSAPYLHDGSVATVEERIYSNDGDRHGVTSTLSGTEKTDLIAYLKSL